MIEVLAVVIRIPPEAVVPLLIICGILIFLGVGGSMLANWQAKHPDQARIAGYLFGAAFTGYAVWRLTQIVPLTYENDRVHLGVYYFSFFDGSVVAACGLMAAIMWRWAGQRWVGLGAGAGIAAALIAKPFIYPLIHLWDESDGSITEHHRALMDLEHLSYIGPGIVCLIVALIVGLAGRKR
jgi:hypothetical protein